VEPVSATTGTWAKIAATLKDWPLWLFVAVGLSLTVFALVPEFRQLVSPAAGRGVLFAAVVAWIFTVCRAITPIVHAFHAYRTASEARIKYVITPIVHQCLWGVAKQSDNSYVTQIAGHFLFNNRTDEPLYLTTAKLISPKIHGEVLPGLLTMQSPRSNMHGTAHVSGHSIPPQATLPVSAMILIRGMPKQNSGPMNVVIEMADANAHKERVKVQIIKNPTAAVPRS
jgi:hypothetical protein